MSSGSHRFLGDFRCNPEIGDFLQKHRDTGSGCELYRCDSKGNGCMAEMSISSGSHRFWGMELLLPINRNCLMKCRYVANMA